MSRLLEAKGLRPHASQNLNSLKGGLCRDYTGHRPTIGVIKGNTRSLDYSSCATAYFCWAVV